MATQDQKTTPQAAPPATTPKRFQEETVAKVLEKVNAFQETGELRLPTNYSPGNALKSAWLILQDTYDKNDKPVLEVCTQASIANALLDMVIKGLSPVKKQCYFVAYGNELSCDDSYFGDQLRAKRDGDVKDFKGHAVYQGDEFEFEHNELTGRTKIITHKSKLENQDPDKTAGAYVIVIFNDGSTHAVVMNMKQIQRSWAQGAAKGASPAHKNFPDRMAIKTVIGRACTEINNSTDDAALYLDGDNREDRPSLQVAKEITQGANKTAISMGNPPPKRTIAVEARPEPALETPPAPQTETVTEEPPY